MRPPRIESLLAAIVNPQTVLGHMTAEHRQDLYRGAAEVDEYSGHPDFIDDDLDDDDVFGDAFEATLRKIDSFDGICDEVSAERERQDAKFGPQDHPSCETPIYSTWFDYRVFNQYGVLSEADAKDNCNFSVKNGSLTWAHIAVEELAEAIDAPDDATRRGELIQLAAVIFHWVQNIDERAAKAKEAA